MFRTNIDSLMDIQRKITDEEIKEDEVNLQEKESTDKTDSENDISLINTLYSALHLDNKKAAEEDNIVNYELCEKVTNIFSTLSNSGKIPIKHIKYYTNFLNLMEDAVVIRSALKKFKWNWLYDPKDRYYGFSGDYIELRIKQVDLIGSEWVSLMRTGTGGKSLAELLETMTLGTIEEYRKEGRV
jgi:hypothetical protein